MRNHIQFCAGFGDQVRNFRSRYQIQKPHLLRGVTDGAPHSPNYSPGHPPKTFYESLEQLQRDLDAYLGFYNRERAHQGYRTQGRTPDQAFTEGVEAMRQSKMEVNPEAA
jgi:hypothetical protein